MAFNPVGNIGSMIERAVIAYLRAAYDPAAAAGYNFYHSNSPLKRSAPAIDVLASRSSEEIIHSRAESFAVRIEAKLKDAAADSVDWPALNNFIGVVMAAMSQTDNGRDYRSTAWGITQAGRRLAVLPDPADANSTTNNADMAQFYCDYLQCNGSQRAAAAGDDFVIMEVRNFTINACNLVDDSVFPALTFDGTNTINWTFTPSEAIAEPLHWLVESSPDGGTWTTFTVLDSAARTADISSQGALYWRVRRSSDGVAGLIPESNLVAATT
jgi:hypothetical protein